MGAFSFITDPLSVRKHAAGSHMSRAAVGIQGAVGAKIAMNHTRFQLKSFEARELFDSKRLGKHLKVYHKLKKHLMRYHAEENEAPHKIEHIQHKYKSRPEVLKKVLMREINVFSHYYLLMLKAIAAVEMDESDLEAQKNASLIADQDRMTRLIAEIPKVAKAKNIALLGDDFEEFKKEKSAIVGEQEKEEREEAKESMREIKQKTAVRGFAHFFAGFTGLGHLAHKVRKLSKRVATHDLRQFTNKLGEIEKDIRSGNVSNVTIAQLRFLLKNYTAIRKHYHEVNTDIQLLMDKLFKDFAEVQKECVIPFYASVRNIPGAEEIKQISGKIHILYEKFRVEASKEKYEIAEVHKHLNLFAHECQKAINEVEGAHKKIIGNLQQEMGFNQPAYAQ